MHKHDYLLFTFMLLLSVGLMGCRHSNSPEATTAKFLTAWSKMDFETIRSVTTKDTWALVRILEEKTKNISEHERYELIPDIHIDILKTVKESDTTVIVSFNSTPRVLPFNKVRLYKEFDIDDRVRWKVQISTINGVEDDQIDFEDIMSFDEEEFIFADSLNQKENP